MIIILLWGAYIFTRENDTLYAILNDEYLSTEYPTYEELYGEFECDSMLLPAKSCDLQRNIYEINKNNYEKNLEAYFQQTPEPYYFANKVVEGMHYFAVDEDFIDFLISYSCGGVGEACWANDFRPFYKSYQRSKRLRLDSLKEFSGDSQLSKPAITFEYNSMNLPTYYTSDFDHWGYYNYRENKPNLTPINTNYSSVFDTYINTDEPIYNGYREANEDKMKACILEKINYPSGGYLKYKYEANRARSNETGTSAKIVGGLRVESIEKGTGDGEKYYNRYDYKIYNEELVGGVSKLISTNLYSGYIHSELLQYETAIGLKWGYEDSDYKVILDKIQVMNSVLPLIKTKKGYVGYSHVLVTVEDDSENKTGATLYQFHADQPLEFLNFTSYPPNGSYGYEYLEFMKYLRPTISDPILGKVKEKIISDNQDRILSKTVKEYCLTEPNYKGSSDYNIYSPYIHSYANTLYSEIPFVTYQDPTVALFPLNEIVDFVPRLSKEYNFSYFPDDQNKVISDSVFYIYDVHNSEYLINSPSTLIYEGATFAPEIGTGTYNSDLDAYGEDGGYSFASFNTQKLLQSLHFKVTGEKERTRYWYPSHLSSTGNVVE